MRPISMAALCLLIALAARPCAAQQATPPPNPFAPPQATLHFAPDREYDLEHLAVTLKIDYPARRFQGFAVNRIVALRDGLATITLHCGKNLTVESCAVNGYTAASTRSDDLLRITPPKPLRRGQAAEVTVHYSGGKHEKSGMMADSGLHWIEPNKRQPDRVGFWTQGETNLNRQWVPTWDYPNHLCTTETTVTVPASWTVIGNGTLRSNRLSADAKWRTFHWQMDEPHATYLLSLVAGPFDIHEAKWRDVRLMYVAPRGKGRLLDYSFEDTPDMLSFFSDTLGVKFAWPKYAQNAMYDFGGGMENVSATTLPESALTDAREGRHNMDSLNAHELAHQWFGDLVTCRDWGHTWLNESFATFFEALYMEHRRGKTAYAREIDGDMRGYIGESHRYRRPIATNLYPNADAMFDAHAYPKGAAVIHTLRRLLGDTLFFAGLHAYLQQHRHTPVDSHDLCRSMSDATGVELEPFFDQWIYKPGHPVLETAWSWDDQMKRVKLTVKQTQDTKDGTPIYTVAATAGLIVNGRLLRMPVALDKAEQTFELATSAKPDAVLLDPDHDFLREVPVTHWTNDEARAIIALAPNPTDRADAMSQLLEGTPPERDLQAVVAAVRADSDAEPVFDLTRLGALKREDLRPLFREQMAHASFARREQAIRALAQLKPTERDTAAIAALVNPREPYGVISAAVGTLGAWDSRGNLAVIQRAAHMASLHEQVRTAAYVALANGKSEEGIASLIAATKDADPDLRYSALSALRLVDAAEPRSREVLRAALKDPDFQTVITAASAIRDRKDKALLPDIQALKAHPPAEATAETWFPGFIDAVITDLSK